MKTIFKYEIKLEPEFELELPFGSNILSIQTQNNKPFIWVLHDIGQFKVKWKFAVIPTGSQIHEGLVNNFNYIGTFQLDGGALVFHLFARIEN